GCAEAQPRFVFWARALSAAGSRCDSAANVLRRKMNFAILYPYFGCILNGNQNRYFHLCVPKGDEG
ncbi:MAG: hypothetical protein IJC61_00825, partial [Oscillospiraceae bacterium]|nr:hypothetical protein [Oscillospiraceae bacterium]